MTLGEAWRGDLPAAVPAPKGAAAVGVRGPARQSAGDAGSDPRSRRRERSDVSLSRQGKRGGCQSACAEALMGIWKVPLGFHLAINKAQRLTLTLRRRFLLEGREQASGDVPGWGWVSPAPGCALLPAAGTRCCSGTGHAGQCHRVGSCPRPRPWALSGPRPRKL